MLLLLIMIFKLLEPIYASILIDILTKYIYMNDYAKLEIAINNKNNKKHMLNLTKKELFMFDTTDTIYEYWFTIKKFKIWILIKQFPVNKLIIKGSILNNKYYLQKNAHKIKILKIINFSLNIKHNIFSNLEEVIIIMDTKINKLKLFDTTTLTNIKKITFQCNYNYVGDYASDVNIWNNINKHKDNKLIGNLNEIIILISKYKNLSSIKIKNCYDVTDISMLEIIKNCNLSELAIYNNYITDNFLIEMSKNENIGNLKILKLCNCSQISDISMTYMFKKCTNIDTLIINKCPNITYKLINILSENCNLIKKLLFKTNISILNANLLTEIIKFRNLEILIISNERSDIIKYLTLYCEKHFKNKLINNTQINNNVVMNNLIENIKINNSNIKIIELD